MGVVRLLHLPSETFQLACGRQLQLLDDNSRAPGTMLILVIVFVGLIVGVVVFRRLLHWCRRGQAAQDTGQNAVPHSEIPQLVGRSDFGDPPLVERAAETLCADLRVPELNCCCLAVPFLLGFDAGPDVVGFQVVDRSGEPLLAVMLKLLPEQTTGPGEYFTLATGFGGSEIARCTVGFSGPECVVCWPDGRAFSVVKEVSQGSGTERVFVMTSHNGEALLTVRCDPRKRRHFIRQPRVGGVEIDTVASVTPGESLEEAAHKEYNQLRVEAGTDASVVVVMCVAIDRVARACDRPGL